MKKHVSKILLYIITSSLVVIFMVSVLRFIIFESSQDYIFDIDEFDKISNCTNIVVLGAKVYENGSMSAILKERAITAIDLYENDKACHFVISGTYDEVYAVEKYLLENGIPKNLISLDDLGIDTFMSMKNVHNRYDLDEIIIVTQDFHLPRAVYIAREIGIDAEGIVAYKYPYKTKLEKYKYIAREWLAAVKAVFQVSMYKVYTN